MDTPVIAVLFFDKDKALIGCVSYRPMLDKMLNIKACGECLEAQMGNAPEGTAIIQFKFGTCSTMMYLTEGFEVVAKHVSRFYQNRVRDYLEDELFALWNQAEAAGNSEQAKEALAGIMDKATYDANGMGNHHHQIRYLVAQGWDGILRSHLETLTQ
ncbi:hypothetical protein [Ferrimonas marina]|uniref:Uncharacterized protein n=1 Tax=Ferrimonas marina TaxID=299255 RepID=A0A1M5TN20_9GAMM|nr:hypothetical protein [Ferrimonas marina]SHH51763.1 hypothetical protein SAMN02745129_2199 [Ferrimonas marina]